MNTTVTSVASGIGAGLLLALVLNQVLAHWAEGSARDPLMLFAVTALLAVVSALACAIPARRASAFDPMTALRYKSMWRSTLQGSNSLPRRAPLLHRAASFREQVKSVGELTPVLC